jgi:hypothetical protein
LPFGQFPVFAAVEIDACPECAGTIQQSFHRNLLNWEFILRALP